VCELRRDGFVLRANGACRALLDPRACTFADSFDDQHAAAVGGALAELNENLPTTSVEARVPGHAEVIRWQLTRVDHDLFVALGRALSPTASPRPDPMARVGELAAEMAHDFNSSLTGTVGATERALEEASAECKARAAKSAGEAGELRQLNLLDAPSAAELPPKLIPRPQPVDSTLPVLLVDDEDAVRRSVKRMLEAAGHRVVSCAAPQAALEKLAGMRGLCLLATDVAMPGLSGQELGKRVREVFPGTPVLLLTGSVHVPPELVSDGLADAQVLLKPFSQMMLTTAIEAAIHPGRHPSAQQRSPEKWAPSADDRRQSRELGS
jgi:FixJ family two-component response regulator